mmetsp:Transcript_166803/g.535405  ORF Transcript_166803/g.535405 Transcript_166803/m.535405 type:complete len:618 (+) Transcript_166803:115-1968(+)
MLVNANFLDEAGGDSVSVASQSSQVFRPICEAHRSQLLQVRVLLAWIPRRWEDAAAGPVELVSGQAQDVERLIGLRRRVVRGAASRTARQRIGGALAPELPQERRQVEAGAPLRTAGEALEDLLGQAHVARSRQERLEVLQAEQVIAVAVGFAEGRPEEPFEIWAAQICTRCNEGCPLDAPVAAHVRRVRDLRGLRGPHAQALEADAKVPHLEAALAREVQLCEEGLDCGVVVRRPAPSHFQGDGDVEQTSLGQLRKQIERLIGVRGQRDAVPEHARVREERQRQQLGSARPRKPVHLHALHAGMAHFLRVSAQLLPMDLRLGSPQGHCFGLLVGADIHRVPQSEKLEDHDAATPDVRLGSDLATPNLGRHSVGRAARPVVFEVPCLEELCHTKVDNHDMGPVVVAGQRFQLLLHRRVRPLVRHQHHIGRLQIQVHNSSCVHVCDGHEHLSHGVRNEGFRQVNAVALCLLDLLRQVSARAQIHHQVQMLGILHELVQPGDVRVVQQCQVVNLDGKEVKGAQVFAFLDDLHCPLVSAHVVPCQDHLAIRALSQQAHIRKIIDLLRVCRGPVAVLRQRHCSGALLRNEQLIPKDVAEVIERQARQLVRLELRIQDPQEA